MLFDRDFKKQVADLGYEYVVLRFQGGGATPVSCLSRLGGVTSTEQYHEVKIDAKLTRSVVDYIVMQECLKSEWSNDDTCKGEIHFYIKSGFYTLVHQRMEPVFFWHNGHF